MYPGQNDIFSIDSIEPISLLSALYSAIEDIESHVGTAALSGGDTSVTITESAAGSSRKLCLLTGVYTVPATMNNAPGIYIRWDTLFDPAALSRSQTNPAIEAINGDLLATIQDPLFVFVYRPYTNTYPFVSIIAGSPSLVALNLEDTDVKLRGGELLNFSFLLYSGIH